MVIDPDKAIEALGPYAHDKCVAFAELKRSKDAERVLRMFREAMPWCLNVLPKSQWPPSALLIRPDVPPNEVVGGERVGDWAEHYLSGEGIKQSGTYLAGQKDGPWTEFYPNGRIQREIIYSNGVLSGTEVQFYKSGVMVARWTNLDGKIHGKAETWYPNGNPKHVGTFKSDDLFVDLKTNGSKGESLPRVTKTEKQLRDETNAKTTLSRT